jgi:NAD(P)-dependent dehydrogenase (short-subunit alcohol dehydrogenase family)
MQNPWDISGKNILITGAGSGIGFETAKYLAGLGARLVLVSKNPQRLEKAAGELNSNPVSIACDLTDADAVAEMMQKATKAVGPLNGLIHCAGTLLSRPITMLSDQQVSESLKVNVRSAFSLARNFATRNAAARPASLVFMSSVMALVGQPAQSLYAATKGALVSMTKSLAIELARQEIRVNCVAAGLVQTGMGKQIEQSLTTEQFEQIKRMHPLGLGTGVDVAAALAFLVGDASRWITGTTLVVDGGYTAH